jgi:phosphoglycerate dehydrogenase-like enzyme
LEREVTILRERTEQNRTRIDDVQKRLDGVDQNVRVLAIVPVQQEGLKQDVAEIKAALLALTREHQQREQWLQSFEVQAKSLQQSREQNMRSSTLVVVGMGVTILLAIVTLVTGILERMIG